MENEIILKMTKSEYEEYQKYLNDKKEQKLQRQELQKYIDSHEPILEEDMIVDEKSGYTLLKGNFNVVPDPNNLGKAIYVKLKDEEQKDRTY